MKQSFYSVFAVSVLLAALTSTKIVYATDSAVAPGIKIAENTDDNTSTLAKKKKKKKSSKKAKKAEAKAASQSTATPVVTPKAAPITVAPSAPAAASEAPKAPFHQGLHNIKASYTGIFEGGYLNQLDGNGVTDTNPEGTGSQLDWRHIPSVGYKFHPNYSINIAQEIGQHLGSDPTTATDNPEGKPQRTFYTITDPYITLSAGSMLNGNGFTMPSMIRYYVPVAELSRTGGTQKDAQNGLLRLQAIPTQLIMNKKIELSMLSRFVYYFASGTSTNYATRTAGSYYKPGKDLAAGSNKDRFNYKWLFIPQVAVNVTDDFQPYIYWQTGYIFHKAAGDYISIKDPQASQGMGQGIEIGFSYNITPKLSINPFLDFGGSASEDESSFKAAEYSILVSYSIL